VFGFNKLENFIYFSTFFDKVSMVSFFGKFLNINNLNLLDLLNFKIFLGIFFNFYINFFILLIYFAYFIIVSLKI
jgi:hypothetical protein